MIKLTAITAEEEPPQHRHGLPDQPSAAQWRHHPCRRLARLPLPRPDLRSAPWTISFVQRLVDEGQIAEEEANNHPQSNLLTGCLGTLQDPPLTLHHIDRLEIGDSLLACSDGLWHYFTPANWAPSSTPCPPRKASEMLVSKARQRARGAGDNLSLASGARRSAELDGPVARPRPVAGAAGGRAFPLGLGSFLAVLGSPLLGSAIRLSSACGVGWRPS